MCTFLCSGYSKYIICEVLQVYFARVYSRVYSHRMCFLIQIIFCVFIDDAVHTVKLKKPELSLILAPLLSHKVIIQF